MLVFVVEDDEKLVRALHKGLGYEGYSVDVARTGEQGLSRATADDYSVVVLDLMLPGLDGFALCEELRRRERWVPVLMLTARVDVSDRIRGLDGGADDYMVKPFDFGELLARVGAHPSRPLCAPSGVRDRGPARGLLDPHRDPSPATRSSSRRASSMSSRSSPAMPTGSSRGGTFSTPCGTRTIRARRTLPTSTSATFQEPRTSERSTAHPDRAG